MALGAHDYFCAPNRWLHFDQFSTIAFVTERLSLNPPCRECAFDVTVMDPVVPESFVGCGKGGSLYRSPLQMELGKGVNLWGSPSSICNLICLFVLLVLSRDDGMTPIKHLLWFPLRESAGSFPHSLLSTSKARKWI